MTSDEAGQASATTKQSRLAKLRAWFVTHRVAFALALITGALTWASLTYLAGPSQYVGIPRRATPVDIHATLLPFPPPTFAVFKAGNSIILVRNRNGEIWWAAFMTGFCFFFLASGYGKLHPKIFEKDKRALIEPDAPLKSAAILFQNVIWIGGAFYLWMLFVNPSLPVIMNPERITLDTQSNSMTFNHKFLCKLSDVDSFYGFMYSGTPHYGEWGVTLKNGKQIVLNDDPAIGGDVTGDSGLDQTLVSYLNQYLKNRKPGISSSSITP